MSQGNSQDSNLDWLWMALLLIVVFIAIRVFFGDQIAMVYVAVRKAWLVLLTSVLPLNSWEAALRFIQTRDVREMSSAQLKALSDDLRWPMMLLWGSLLAWYGYGTIKNNPAQRFRRMLTRQSLAKEMTADFPWILPVLDKNLVDEPIDRGPWMMAQTPLQFAQHRKLLNGVALDPDRAERAFVLQLGKLWVGPERLNPTTKALFGIFAALVHYKKTTESGALSNMNKGEVAKFKAIKDQVDAALRELVVSRSGGAPVYTKAQALFDQFAHSPHVETVCARHAYQRTVMVAMFFGADEAGIFPPNFFLWLRPIDRTLWLSLNCVRRRTYFSEVGGVYAHYLAETTALHKIEEPMVGKAVLALDLALKSIKFDPADGASDVMDGSLLRDYDPRAAERETTAMAGQIHTSANKAAGLKADPFLQPPDRTTS